MFLEPSLHNKRSGWIEVITGSMFSGKTEELMRRINRAQIAGLKIEIFKPSTDVRYDAQKIVSHNDNKVQSTPVQRSKMLLNVASDVDLVAIDEAQFFDEEIVDVAQELALKGIRVLVAGLDMDYSGKPFGSMPQLMSVAEYITKLHAICVHCGNLATHSYRTKNEKQQVLLGSDDLYEARCRKCFDMGHIMEFKKPKKSDVSNPPGMFD